MRVTSFAVLAAAFGSVVSAIDTIEIKDRHFYNAETGDPFFMKGIDYQPGGSSGVEKGKDPLSDPDICARDIFLFQKLGVNTIRIYSVDPALDHDECMTMLAAAGIYLVLDVNSPLPNQHLHDTEPWTTYNKFYLEHIFQVIEVFSGYDNTLAFLAGNEVVHNPGSELTVPPYLKAVVRDMKGYITNHIHRAIPVGYSNADNIEFRISLAEYLACGNTGYVDFWAINSYQWCGSATFEGSGYDQLVAGFQNYSLPIFFSEYGCNEVRPRIFKEVEAIYSDQMTGVFSGGLVYEFTQEPADYGIVEVNSKEEAVLTKEFDTLAEVHAAATNPQIPSDAEKNPRMTTCRTQEFLPGITVADKVPIQLDEIKVMVVGGIEDGKWKKGGFLDVKKLTLETTHKITDSDGEEITDKKIEIRESTEQKPIPEGGHGKDTGGGVGDKLPVDNSPTSSGSTDGGSDDGDSDDDEGAASSISLTFGSACIAAVALLFSAL